MALREAIGTRMRSERERLHMTQSDLAVALGVIRLTIQKYESGATCPGIDQLQTLKAIGFDTDYVVDGYFSLWSETGRNQFADVLRWVRREAAIAGMELTTSEQVDAAWAAFDQLKRRSGGLDLDSAVIRSALTVTTDTK